MKQFQIIGLFITSLFLLSTLTLAQNKDDDGDWYPFVIPAKLDPNSPANIGKLVLDAPAGKHGFCKVKDGHFYFEDGTRVKFWGTNICFEACFPDHQTAELIAAKLAGLGFNAVRFHQIDLGNYPVGLFANNKSTKVISDIQLEKFDYFVNQLEKQGIYIYLSLHSGRLFKEADGVKDASLLPRYAQYVTLFDQVLIDLQKEFARNLLTHINPYTKISYANDPAVICIEITNENSLFLAWERDVFSNLPTFYNNQFINLWNKWLIANHAKSSDSPIATLIPFSRRFLYSNSEVYNFIQFIIDTESSYFSSMINFLKNDLGVKSPIISTNNFVGLASLKSQEVADIIDTHSYWDHPIFHKKGSYVEDFTIHNKSYIQNYRYGPVADIARSAIYRKPQIASEWNHCFPNQYSYELPLMLPAYAAFQGWDGLFVFNYHTYGHWNSNKIKDVFEIDTNSNKLAIFPTSALAFLKGYVKESDKTMVFSYDANDMYSLTNLYWSNHQLSSPSSRANIALKHKIRRRFGTSNLNELSEDIFQIDKNGVIESDTKELYWYTGAKNNYVRIDSPYLVAAIGFLIDKDIVFDGFKMKCSNNASISLITLDGNSLQLSKRMLLTTVGKCQNTRQEYSLTKKTLMQWGTAPILLQLIKTDILCDDQTIRIYALEKNGNRGKEILGEKTAGNKILFSLQENTPWYELVR